MNRVGAVLHTLIRILERNFFDFPLSRKCWGENLFFAFELILDFHSTAFRDGNYRSSAAAYFSQSHQFARFPVHLLPELVRGGVGLEPLLVLLRNGWISGAHGLNMAQKR